jgi:hypothetical protein
LTIADCQAAEREMEREEWEAAAAQFALAIRAEVSPALPACLACCLPSCTAAARPR